MLHSPVINASEFCDAVCARGASQPLTLGLGDLQAWLTRFDNQTLLLLCFDYTRHQGSISIAEAHQLQQAIHHAREHKLPMVWLIESSGIRVTDGTAGIASLRRVLRDMTDARIDGLRLLAMVFKSAFGGASLLACMCERRVMNPASLLSMSGPKLIQQSVGSQRFNAADTQAVMDVMGGAERASRSADMVLVEANMSAYMTALDVWLATAQPLNPGMPWLQHQLALLCERLPQPLTAPQALPLPSPLLPLHTQALLERVLPAHSGLHACDGVLIAQAAQDAHTRVLALMTPEGCSARDALALTRELLQPLTARLTRTVLLVDAPGHAATPE